MAVAAPRVGECRSFGRHQGFPTLSGGASPILRLFPLPVRPHVVGCRRSPQSVMTSTGIVIASGEAARQSRVAVTALDCFASLAMTKCRSNIIMLYGLWGSGVRRAASSVRHAELVSASMAGPLLLCRLSGEGRPWTPGSGPGQALKQVGVYTPETGTLVIPGESRDPCEVALCHLDPGFRRGTLTCRKGVIAKQVQGDERDKPCRNPNP